MFSRPTYRQVTQPVFDLGGRWGGGELAEDNERTDSFIMMPVPITKACTM